MNKIARKIALMLAIVCNDKSETTAVKEVRCGPSRRAKRTWARCVPLLILIGLLAACAEPAVPAKATPSPAPTPTPATEASCADSAIRLSDREDASVHGAILDDTLHMGGATAPATCTEAANLSLLAAFSIPDGRTAQVQQSQYYLIRIQYPNRTLLYIIKRRVDGTACVVDTNDICVATVSGLPDDFDVSDLPDDVPQRIPAGRDAPEPPATTDTAPDAVENPYPTNQATGVTVDAPLLSWAASPRATSYDLYWGATKDLAADDELGTPINTPDTAVSIPRPDATAAERRLAGDTTYYWRVDAKNNAGVTRGNVWSFTTGAALPNVAGIYEGNTTYVVTTTPEGDVVRQEVETRERNNVWQVAGTEVVMYAGTLLEVFPGDDSAVRGWLNGFVGKQLPLRFCILYPDGTCRLCTAITATDGSSFSCDEWPSRADSSVTFDQLSSQMSQRVQGSATISIVGTYEKVADDPGPLPAAPEVTPPEPIQPEPEPEPAPQPRPATCDDSAIRLLDHGAGIHGAIVSDTLHMGGATAPATCTAPASRSLLAGLSMPDEWTAQVQQSQYYLMVIRYPGGNRMYVVSRRADGTSCVVDTNDECIAQVTDLPDDFDLEDLPDDVAPTIPAGRPAPPTVAPPPGPGVDMPPAPAAPTGSPPGASSNPQPRDGATGVTVDAPLLSWAAAPRALSYDVYWGTANTDLGTSINTLVTAFRIADSMAAGTRYYWRVDAKNDAGTTRGAVWSFTTGR